MTRFVWRHSKLLAEWFRFAIVGIGATLTYLIASLVANSVQLDAYWANLLGYLSSVAVSYFGHAHVTFQSSQPHRVQGPKFIVVSLVTFGLTNIIVFVSVGLLDQNFLTASIMSCLLDTHLTWFPLRFWVFRAR